MGGLSVLWRAGGLVFATPVERIAEVLPPLACRAAPATPPWVRGLFSHRGTLIPLVDAARLIGVAPGPDVMANRVLVVRCSPGPDFMPWTTGLWVDAVLDIARIEFDAPSGHPGFAVETGRFLGPVAQTPFGPVQRIEPESLFTREQAAVLADRLKEAAA